MSITDFDKIIAHAYFTLENHIYSYRKKLWRISVQNIESKSLAILHASLKWQSDFASHEETIYIPLNVWRELELLPNPLAQALLGQRAGFVFKTSFSPGSLVPEYDMAQEKLFSKGSYAKGQRQPRLGRFYPRGMLLGYSQIPALFRCSTINGGTFAADFNHPLAKHTLDLEVTVAEVQKKRADTGGVCQDWLQIICDGPGMQIRQSQTPTDFFADDPFSRVDVRDDTIFYEKPRLVNHIDDQADATIQSLYERLLKPGSNVLDLMSSLNSHIPPSLELKKLSGLGLNHEELAKNPRLTDYVVQDLNGNPTLPFADQQFEAVICTVSIEYLIHPEADFPGCRQDFKTRRHFYPYFLQPLVPAQSSQNLDRGNGMGASRPGAGVFPALRKLRASPHLFRQGLAAAGLGPLFSPSPSIGSSLCSLGADQSMILHIQVTYD